MHENGQPDTQRVNFQARGDWVLIRPHRKRRTKGGIELPEGSDDPNALLRGEVVSVGEGSYGLAGNFIPTTLHPGDMVYLSFKGSPSKVRIDGETFMLAQEEQITGYVPEPEA